MAGWEWFCDDEYGPRWITLTEQSARFEADKRYRRKPKTILINGYEVPEPLRVAPPIGIIVYMASLSVSPCDEIIWRGHEGHLQLLKEGVLHLDSDAACTHTEALLSFTSTAQE